jgi:hypothetical protein
MRVKFESQITVVRERERRPAAGCFWCCRVFAVGMMHVTLLSAGGAVTPHTMIRDIVVHEEYRNKGVKFLLNDIGTMLSFVCVSCRGYEVLTAATLLTCRDHIN